MSHASSVSLPSFRFALRLRAFCAYGTPLLWCGPHSSASPRYTFSAECEPPVILRVGPHGRPLVRRPYFLGGAL
jgi:hypothetical protein